ncbi:hypothetical protein Tco_0429329 [Tanacetum coccineum]
MGPSTYSETIIVDSERDRLIVVDRDMFVMFEHESSQCGLMLIARISNYSVHTPALIYWWSVLTGFVEASGAPGQERWDLCTLKGVWGVGRV